MNVWRRWGTLSLALAIGLTTVFPMGAAGIPAPLVSKGTLAFDWSLPKDNPVSGIPTDVVVDASGNAYVADEAGFVSVWDKDGKYVRSFGAGSIEDTRALDDPHGISLDASGNVLVADNDREAIFRFTTSGELLSVFYDSNMCEPEQAAENSAGVMFVADSCESDVWVYDKDGNLVKDITSVCDPRGVAVDKDGNFWVSEGCNYEDRILIQFDQYGEEIGWAGDRYAEEFGSAARVHIGDDGSLWVTETDCEDIWRFDPETGDSVPPSNYWAMPFSNPMAAAPGPDGALWVADDSAWMIWKGQLGEPMMGARRAETPSEKAAASSRRAAEVPRSSKADRDEKACTKSSGPAHSGAPAARTPKASRRAAVGTPRPLTAYGLTELFTIKSWNRDDGGLEEPNAAAVAPDGSVWVSDANGRLQVTDSEGATLTTKISLYWGTQAIAFTPTGTVVTANGDDNLIHFNLPDGTDLGTIGAGLSYPQGVAVDATGAVYVSDTGNNRIVRYNTDSSVEEWSKGYGSGDLEFANPHGIAVGSDGVYVADSSNYRIKKYAFDGSLVATWGVNGTGPGEFWYPTDIGVDSSGRVYVLDEGLRRIQVFDGNGGFIGAYGENGPSADPGTLIDPHAMAVGPGNSVYVGEYDLSRLQKFTLKLGIDPSRIGGADRYEVAAGASGEAFDEWAGVKHVVLASGDPRACADTISAAGLCGAYDAPLLLVRSDRVPASTLAAVKAIVAKNGKITVHVVGGTASIPTAVLNSLSRSVGSGKLVFDRIKPDGDRYGLANAIAVRMKRVLGSHMGTSVFIANGTSPAIYDAVGLTAVVAKTHSPVLYTKRWQVPGPTWAGIQSIVPERRFVVGRSLRVSELVRTALMVPGRNRIEGINAYDNAAAIADRAVYEDWLTADKVGVACAMTDIVSAGPSLGHAGAPLLLTAGDALPVETADWLSANKSTVKECLVYGGEGTVSKSVFDAVANALQ